VRNGFTERSLRNQKQSYEKRYYITSLALDARQIGEAIRAHWGVENGLHWILDVTFRDDQSRVRTGYAAENLALLRRLALSLIAQERTLKGSVRGRRARAGWDTRYLEKVLGL
jgi:predicted transposase YbfD/YdcC